MIANTYNHKSLSLALIALTAILPLVPAGAPAQVGPHFAENGAAVLVGNISINPRKPITAPPGLYYVEGPVRFTATVYRQNPDSYRATGDFRAGGAFQDGSASVRLGQYKITTKQIVEAVLPNNVPPAGQNLLWRSEPRNISDGYKSLENVGGGIPQIVISALRVGNLETVPREDALGIIRLDFTGTALGKSILESGSYTSEPVPGALLGTKIAGERRGFIIMVGYLMDLRKLDDKLRRKPRWLRRGAFEPTELHGLLSINRRIQESNLLGTSYEVGTISGRFYGYLD
ncbi:MAG: hypothetical protein ACO3PN_11275 [Chthoniobacterales bacterium]